MADLSTRLDEIADGFRGSAVLLAACRLGVFDVLGREEKDAGEVAAALGADRRGTRILLDALVALGLLEKTGGRYRAGAVVREHLLADSPRPRRAMLAHRARLYQRWGYIYDAVVSGGRVGDEVIDPRLDSGEEAFAAAMADVGRESARATVETMAERGLLDGVGRLLDVAGGPGLYALEMARRVPGLTAVVLDRPATAEVARAHAREAGLADRVEARGGDALEDELGGPWDLVFCSNFVHVQPPEANRRLVGRAAAALATGGRLVLKDFFLDPDRTTPPGGTLFAVNMLVSTDGGDCYTVEEAAGWLRDAGLEPEPAVDVTPQSRLMIGRRAG